MMYKANIVQTFISALGAKSYLEIGTHRGQTFFDIIAKHKVGIDPMAPRLFPIKGITRNNSDDFFAENKKTFDVILIDGLHYAEQAKKDIENALAILNSKGVIVVADLLPPREHYQVVPPELNTIQWTGDTWKTWVRLSETREDLSMFVVDADLGCGIITVGSQDLLENDKELNWENFDRYKQQWMNIISEQDFSDRYETSMDRLFSCDREASQ